MNSSSYVPLRVRSNYSLLTGASSVDALVRRAASAGLSSIALTDEENLYGAVPFFQKAREQGLRPILGAIVGGATVLVQNARGYANLCEIITRRNLYPDEPWEDTLARCQEGLAVLASAVGFAERMAGKLDAGRMWIECRRSERGNREDERVLAGVARRLGAGVAAVADVYFSDRRDLDLCRLLHAIRTHRGLFQMRESAVPVDAYLRTPTEFEALFADLPDAVAATRNLAESCTFDLMELATVFPRVHGNAGSILLERVRLGAQRKYGQIPARVWHRLNRECELITRMGFADYFLVVEDIVRYARTLGAPVAGRGSGASSIAAYCLGITNVDPLRYDLPFERFLNEARDDYPDLDLDFSWRLRDRVIDYVYQKYGRDHVAMIATHVTMQPRLAFREVAQALGMPHAVLTRVADKLELGLPRERWGELPVAAALVEQAVAFARRCDGFPHHVSVHCGGVVITPGPIFHRAPLQRAAKGVVITQFDKDAAEAVGLVKLDLLGNRALSSIRESASLVRELRGMPVDLECLPERDEETARLLAAGETMGVNQLESPAMRRLLRQIRPTTQQDLMKVLALIRPGAGSLGMKDAFIRRCRGLEPAGVQEPRLGKVLGDTHGIMLYEDDALQVARTLGNLPGAEADRFRRAVTKCRSDSERLTLSREFLECCRRNQVDPRVSADLWVQMAKFNSYSFCRAHAASYARVAWANAYMKAHGLLEFWVGTINNNQGMYAPWVYVETARQEGIRLLAPCVNRSADEFTAETGAGEGSLRIGLDRIRELSARGRESIRAGRPFRDLTDLISRTCLRLREVGNLVLAGALDFTGRSRPQMMEEARVMFHTARNLRGQPTLFPLPLPELPAESGEYSDMRRCQDEWRTLGLSTVRHPVEYVRPVLARKGFLTSRELGGRVGRIVRLCGIPAAARVTTAKDGRTMGFVTLSDETGLFEVSLFPRIYAEHRALLGGGDVGLLWVAGKVESEYDAITITADRLGRMEPDGG